MMLAMKVGSVALQLVKLKVFQPPAHPLLNGEVVLRASAEERDCTARPGP